MRKVGCKSSLTPASRNRNWCWATWMNGVRPVSGSTSLMLLATLLIKDRRRLRVSTFWGFASAQVLTFSHCLSLHIRQTLGISHVSISTTRTLPSLGSALTIRKDVYGGNNTSFSSGNRENSFMDAGKYTPLGISTFIGLHMIWKRLPPKPSLPPRRASDVEVNDAQKTFW
eukprot:CAMPEP_0170320372 /NCGR_PEP_ID=MMETSP0116_2-20130129/60919_1 /TAXON_ID=400756 /ORGANISM="Durinskia baltica, Strain CSIRO CS-38" /LENGTH=170 /DNA_ID=CAMNT_0010573141 /DNA_START=45 /DNA_END=555 /DNA_ORIENTATION=+